eukprot:COSAG01_NODE_52314_length_347_cov_1.044355_1_plen_41_part_01
MTVESTSVYLVAIYSDSSMHGCVRLRTTTITHISSVRTQRP